MSFIDVLYALIVFFVLILVWNVMDFVWQTTAPAFNSSIDPAIAGNLSSGITKNEQFYDASFAALFIIVLAISAVLTVFLASHPVVLMVWLLFNTVMIFVYDALNDYLTAFLLTDLNTGVMNTAVAFFQSGVPKALIIGNVLMAVVLLGKRGVGG